MRKPHTSLLAWKELLLSPLDWQLFERADPAQHRYVRPGILTHRLDELLQICGLHLWVTTLHVTSLELAGTAAHVVQDSLLAGLPRIDRECQHGAGRPEAYCIHRKSRRRSQVGHFGEPCVFKLGRLNLGVTKPDDAPALLAFLDGGRQRPCVPR
jgi:hypothetical protein